MINENLKKIAKHAEKNLSEKEWDKFRKVYFTALEEAEGSDKEELEEWFKVTVRNMISNKPGIVPHKIEEYIGLCF